MAKLYEIDHAVLEVLDNGFSVDEETGEILWDDENFDSLIKDRNAKLEATGLYIKDCEAEASKIKAEEKALAERRKVHERKAERLKAYILSSMETMGDKKFETPRVAINLRKTTSVIVEDMGKLPEDFIKIKTDLSPDKVAIKKAIKSGQEVIGARIEEYNSVGIK